jgi:type I restriction enzyme S subunit
MGMSGSIGKLAFNRSQNVYLLNQRVGRLEPIVVEKQFLYYFLRTIEQRYLEISFGMAIKNLSTEQINETPFPLPPLAEQRRIVAKVDELLELCDELEARQTAAREQHTRLVSSALDHLITAKDEHSFRKHSAFVVQHSDLILDSVPALRQAIFSLAVQGHLVPQNPKDEPVSAHLSRIDKAKAKFLSEAGIRRAVTFPEVLQQEAPYQIPANWKWARVGVVGMAQTGSTPPTAEPQFFGDFIPFVKPADLTDREINYRGEGLSKSGIEKSSLIASGSVLMVCIGGSIGKTNLNTKDVCCNQQINALTPYADTNSRYIMICMKSAWFQDKVKEDAGQTTLPIISKGKWEQLPIPLPPVPEQQRIVAKVDELMRWCDALEAGLAVAQSTATHLLDATLDRALKGEL